MAGPGAFTFGGSPAWRPDTRPSLASAPMATAGWLRPAAEAHRSAYPPPRHLRCGTGKRRTSSPLTRGPPRKRRSTEERVIGALEDLSLSGRREGRLARWRQLEDRLSPGLEESEEADAASSVVLSEELQKLVSGPAEQLLPPLTPLTPSVDNSLAVVLWQPPVLPPLPPADASISDVPAQPSDSAADDMPLDLLADIPAKVDAQPPAYDFTPFWGPQLAGDRGPAEQQQQFLFGQAAEASVPFPGFGQPLPDYQTRPSRLADESMEL